MSRGVTYDLCEGVPCDAAIGRTFGVALGHTLEVYEVGPALLFGGPAKGLSAAYGAFLLVTVSNGGSNVGCG